MGIFSVLSGVASTLFGGGSSGGNQNLVSTLADKILPQTQKEKEAASLAADQEALSEEKQGDDDTASARGYDPKDMPVIVYQPGMGLIPWLLLWILDLIDHIVDSVNHAIRPVGLIWAGLVLSGKIPVPPVQDAKMWTIFLTMVSFFYGGRMIVKDIIPGLVSLLKK